MQKTKLISQLLVGGLLSFVLATLGNQAVQARRTVSLPETKCVSTGPGRWRPYKSDVAVGRAVYTSRLSLAPGNAFVSMTCRIMPEGYDTYFQTLNLEYGMRDNDSGSPPTTVNIYLDGQRKHSRTIAPGQKDSISFDVTNVNNVAIETICSNRSQYCGRVYFFQTALVPFPPPPDESK
jgi:hypothetical protein